MMRFHQLRQLQRELDREREALERQLRSDQSVVTTPQVGGLGIGPQRPVVDEEDQGLWLQDIEAVRRLIADLSIAIDVDQRSCGSLWDSGSGSP